MARQILEVVGLMLRLFGLFIVLSALFLVIVLLVGGVFGMGLGLIVVVILNIGTYYKSDKWVLRR